MTGLSSKSVPEHHRVMTAAAELILSASGWRKIFGKDGGESTSPEIDPADQIVIGAMAIAFGDAVLASTGDDTSALVAVAMDSRPTGPAIADIIIRVLISKNLDVCFSGVTAVPELLSTVQKTKEISAFAYISASHNPIGYNGLKFGFADGSVVGGKASEALIQSFSDIVKNTPPPIIDDLITRADQARVAEIYSKMDSWKGTTYAQYAAFTRLIAADTENPAKGMKLIEELKLNSSKRPIGILADFNGSARAVSIDAEILRSAGCDVETMNDIPGKIAHRIVPEGESLDPCRIALEKLHNQKPQFCLGYVPDNDGDRGNLVYIDNEKKARILHAQDVFALSCLSELAYLTFLAGNGTGLTAENCVIAANGPTSMSVDTIASCFGARVERAEVGESNVVNLARTLRDSGATVRILGEGAAGGTIIHPAACRDPLNTIFSVLKLLLIRETPDIPGLFKIWCEKSGQLDRYSVDFTFQDVMDTLPRYTTTGAYEERAIMRISTVDHGLLKEKYEQMFKEKWPGLKASLDAANFAVEGWEILNYEGVSTRPGAGNRDRDGAQRGGLKVLFTGPTGVPVAYLWMRGSGTEPVFRILADVKGERPDVEKLLLNYHRGIIEKADKLG
jgi:phosphoglucomutase